MSAEESLKAGNLEQAKGLLTERVRAEPANPKHRIFLFQLLSILGEWDRAMTQLNVLSDMDAASLGMTQVYREAIRCEILRGEVFAGKRSPLVLGEPDPWIALLMEALRLTSEGRHENAEALRSQAFEQAPAVGGSIEGQPFEWIADADPRLGPVLELIMNGKYYWVPLPRIAELHLEAPTDLRDFVWAPVQIKWVNGGEAVGLIPVRYTGSESSPSSAIRLARRTEWDDEGPACARGLGQRLLATDRGEYPLLDVRNLRLDAPTTGPPAVSRA